MTSLKRNVVYSSILTISGYLFPLLTYPYVTRVLGVTNIGVYNFVDSIVQYFIIFSMIGVATVGVREIARSKGNNKELSKVFSSLLSINLIFTVISIVILILCTLFIPKLQYYSQMFYIGTAKILANSLLVEWLYKGLENFRYITVRSIIVRSIYVIAVFIFVREVDDYVLYFFLTTLMFVFNAIVNLVHSKNFVKFSLKEISLNPYIKSCAILGLYQVLTNLYTTFNVIYLGFVTDETQVGYYTTATKLYSIIMSLYTAFTGVMMPRMSSLLAEGKIEDFKRMTTKSVEALFAFALPLMVISIVCTPQIVQIIAGTGYDGAIIPMRIVMPLMLVIGYEQILILQILTPLKKDSAILKNSILGASVGMLLNILLVSKFGCNGTAVVWLLSEFTVLITAQYFVSKYINYRMPLRAFFKRIIYTIPITVLCYFLNMLIPYVFGSVVVVAMIVIVYFVILEIFILKNKLIIDNLNRLLSKIGV